MGVLRISLFGDVRVTHEDGLPEAKVTRTIQALLAYLLLQRHRNHPREVLAGLFWGDRSEARARNCLNTALWRLRRVLEPEGASPEAYLVTTPAGEIGFNRASDHWLDVAIFEEQVSPVLAKPIPAMEPADARQLEGALQLYAGDLLEGFYDDWALRERERLRSLRLNSLAHLMRYYKHHGAYEESLACGHQILHLDPLREEIHREVMRLYLESGQRALSVRQYETCREILAAELGIPPMEETAALYAQILPQAGHGSVQPTVVNEPATLQQAVQQLHRAIQDLDEARGELRRSVQLVERFANHQDMEHSVPEWVDERTGR